MQIITRILPVAATLLVAAVSQADVTITPWTPVFKGIEHSVGQMAPPGTNILGQPIGASVSPAQRQVVHVVRVDLTDPDIQLFTDPPCTNCGNEALALSTTNFVKTYGVQVAVNANFFQNPEPQSEGTPWAIVGQHISQGRIVSPQDSFSDAAALLFTTNKQSFMVLNNFPPTNTAGIYTAVTGRYPLVQNGVNVGNNATSPIPGLDPRTAIGVSDDGRYLFLLTVDGRQFGSWSDGAYDEETGAWLIAFGAYNAVNMDGGGSTTMAFADCAGNGIEINRSAYNWAEGHLHERILPSHLGVFAKRLSDFINDIKVTPGSSSAAISWTTLEPATSLIYYGLDTDYNFSTALETTLMTTHFATLTGLTAGTTYYYQIVSETDVDEFSAACSLRTASDASISIFPLTQSWLWTSNNLDGTTWMARIYSEFGWTGPNAALICDENSTGVFPRNTQVGPNYGAPFNRVPAFTTYYFRTHFGFNGSTAGVSLTFSNYIDDAAVFYLNGTEVSRIRMQPAPSVVTYNSYGNGFTPCNGDATCPDVFTITGDLVATNLMTGDNVIAVEVHQATPGNTDMVFGCALSYSRPGVTPPPPKLTVVRSGPKAIISWTGSGVALQQATSPTGTWYFVPGPATVSPYTNLLSDPASFYRLRN